MVYTAAESKMLPPMDVLDAQAPNSYDIAVAEHATDDLGGPHRGVTLDVHRRMLDLYASGAIPRTTPASRLRNKCCSTYRVPPTLEEALQHSYIHPNLPAPRGHVWQGRAGIFRLMQSGG